MPKKGKREMSEFISLRCPNCEGELEYDETTFKDAFYVAADGAVVFIGFPGGQETLTCKYCNSKFERKCKFERFGEQTTVVAAGDRSVAIGGTFSGTIITGDRNKAPGDGRNVIITGSRTRIGR